MRLKIRICICNLLLICGITANCQNRDTVEITSHLLQVIHTQYSLSNGVYKVNDSIVSEEFYKKFTKEHDSSWTFIMDKALGKYCKLYDENSVLREEGEWYFEFWGGPYKKYHSNGKIAEIGNFSLSDSKLGEKVGVWCYYSFGGKLLKKEKYDESGKLLKTINK